MNRSIKSTVGTLLGGDKGLKTVPGDEPYLGRVKGHDLSFEEFPTLREVASAAGVTGRFKEVVDYFGTPDGETPPGFRVQKVLEEDGALRFDLVRDISYDRNGQKRPTGLIFSVDTANP